MSDEWQPDSAPFEGRWVDQRFDTTVLGSSAAFRHARVERSRFVGLTRHTDLNLGHGRWPSVFVDCTFEDCEFQSYSPGFATLLRCSFVDCTIARWNTHGLSFEDCSFTDSRLVECTFRGPGGRRTVGTHPDRRFTGNDLSGADLEWVHFTFGVDLAANRMPSPDDGYFCFRAADEEDFGAILDAFEGRLVHVGPGPSLRATLMTMQEDWADGQRDFTIRVSQFAAVDGPVAREVAEFAARRFPIPSGATGPA